MPLLASCLLDMVPPHARTAASKPARRLLELLELPPATAPAEARRRYLQHAKRWHPDVCQAEDATERFALLQACWEAYALRYPRPWTERVPLDDGDDDDGQEGATDGGASSSIAR